MAHSIRIVFVADTRPISHRVGPSVRRSVSPSYFAFFAFLGILRVEKFVFEHAPAQITTAPAQLITAPAQPPATGVAVYTALFSLLFMFQHWNGKLEAGAEAKVAAPA